MRRPGLSWRSDVHHLFCPPGCRRHSVALTVAAVIVLLGGCSAQQDVRLAPDGSGQATTDITLDPVFASYLRDLSMGLGADQDAPLFDVAAVRAALGARPGISVLDVRETGERQLRVAVGFDSVEALLAAQSDMGGMPQRFLRFERTESFRRLAARIDRNAIAHLIGMAGIDPFISESLLPPEDGMSPADYRDYLAWAFEEYADGRPLDRVFGSSEVVTTVRPEGVVVQTRGGETTDGAVRFTIPLVEAVTRREPLQYSLVYRLNN